jgi:hypothetical protein
LSNLENSAAETIKKLKMIEERIWKVEEKRYYREEVVENEDFEAESRRQEDFDTFNLSKTLENRMKRLEKMNIHKRAMESQRNYEEEFNAFFNSTR